MTESTKKVLNEKLKDLVSFARENKLSLIVLVSDKDIANPGQERDREKELAFKFVVLGYEHEVKPMIRVALGQDKKFRRIIEDSLGEVRILDLITNEN